MAYDMAFDAATGSYLSVLTYPTSCSAALRRGVNACGVQRTVPWKMEKHLRFSSRGEHCQTAAHDVTPAQGESHYTMAAVDRKNCCGAALDAL